MTFGKVTTIIIPSLPYDIQIIPTDNSSPYNVVNSFDFSYVKTFFDGKEIYTTFDGLLSLKYAITICTPTDEDNSVTNTRLYKTLLKGLNIQYNSDIKNNFIKDDTIDVNAMEQNEELQMMLSKPITIRKLSNHLSGVEMLPLIKTYYSSGQVTMNLDNLQQDVKAESNDEYDKFTKNIIAYTDIVRLVDDFFAHGSFQYLGFELEDDRVIKSISLETGFKPIFQIFNGNDFSKDIAFLFELNNDLQTNIIQLQNTLDRVWKAYFKKKSKLTNLVKITYDIGDEDDCIQCLKVHVPENSAVYKKHKDEILKLKPDHVVNFKCVGKLGYAKGTKQPYMKFVLDSFDCLGFL